MPCHSHPALASKKHKYMGHHILENLSEISRLKFNNLKRYLTATGWINYTKQYATSNELYGPVI